MQTRLVTEGLSEYAILLIEAVARNDRESRVKLEAALKILVKENESSIVQEMLMTIEELLPMKVWRDLDRTLTQKEVLRHDRITAAATPTHQRPQ